MKLSSANIISKLLPGTASVGLEITDQWVKMVELQAKRSATPHVRAYGQEPLPEGAVVEGRVVNVLAVMQAIQAVRQQADIRSRHVHMILPSQHIMVRFLKLPDIPDHEMKKLIAFELRHNIHLPFEEPYYDFVNLSGTQHGKKLVRAKKKEDEAAEQGPAAEASPFDLLAQPPEEPQGAEADVMLVAASMELIREYKEAAQAAGCEPVSMEIKALSLYRVLHYTRQVDPEGTLLFVDLNDQAADVSIFHRGKLAITRSLQVNFHYLRQQPESEPPDDPLEQLLLGIASLDTGIDNLCAELVHELERLMNFYRYTLNNRDQEFDRILITGDIARFPEVVNELRGRLNQTVTVLEARQPIERYSKFDERFAALAVPYGLALRGRS